MSPTIAVDGSDNIFISFTVTIPGGTSLNTSALVKLNSDGVTQWFINKTNNKWLNALSPPYTNQQSVIAINGGTPYIAYTTNGIIPTGTPTGSNDIVVLKITEVSNSFCAQVGESFLTVGQTALVYTTEAINALIAGVVPTASPIVSWAPAGLNRGVLLRDLGRTKTYTVNGSLVFVFRNVQLIAGYDTEGVSGTIIDGKEYLSGWICTWAASGRPYLSG